MAAKQRGRAGDTPSARPHIETHAEPVRDDTGPEVIRANNAVREESEAMSSYGAQAALQQIPIRNEGVTVVGEAVQRVSPESAEFLLEINTSAPNAAQALRDNQARTAQITQAVAPLGVQAADVQTVSLNVCNLYSPAQALSSAYSNITQAALPAYGPQAGPGYGNVPQAQYGTISQIGQTGFPGFSGSGPHDVQFGAYHAKSLIRVNVRETARVGEVLDSASRAGATVVGGFSFRAADEAAARRAALEAAGRDARAKAEALASASGRQIGDAVSITEDIVASNGAYAALRATIPFAFGSGAPQVTGDLEYYARVSASFRLQ
jgi:uncharacterized protein YggE